MEIKIRATLKQKMNCEEKIGLSAGEASEKGSILEKLVLFMPKNVKKTH